MEDDLINEWFLFDKNDRMIVYNSLSGLKYFTWNIFSTEVLVRSGFEIDWADDSTLLGLIRYPSMEPLLKPQATTMLSMPSTEVFAKLVQFILNLEIDWVNKLVGCLLLVFSYHCTK